MLDAGMLSSVMGSILIFLHVYFSRIAEDCKCDSCGEHTLKIIDESVLTLKHQVQTPNSTFPPTFIFFPDAALGPTPTTCANFISKRFLLGWKLIYIYILY